MKTINKIQVLMIALLCTGFTDEGTWIIDSESRLSIHGSTNINRFICQVSSYSGRDTLQYFSNYTASELQFTTNRMTIAVRNFDCGSRQMSRDFQYTLKSERHPNLEIRFISLGCSSLKHNQHVNGRVDIALAGITRRYTIHFQTDVKKNTVTLSGAKAVNFSDFRLSAPEKLNGMIRVKDTLDVEFHLVLKPVSIKSKISLTPSE